LAAAHILALKALDKDNKTTEKLILSSQRKLGSREGLDSRLRGNDRGNPDKDNRSLVYNLGTGHGYSVKQVIDMAKKITNIDFKVKMSPRREGDPAELVADNSLAQKELGFQPKYSDLETIIGSAWKWHREHPDGY